MIGDGRAELDFGNCNHWGQVKAYIDGNEIGSASAQDGSKKVEFEFGQGSKLEIIEDPKAIIQFNSLEIIECIGNTVTKNHFGMFAVLWCKMTIFTRVKL